MREIRVSSWHLTRWIRLAEQCKDQTKLSRAELSSSEGPIGRKAHVHGQEYVMPTTHPLSVFLTKPPPAGNAGISGRACSSQHLRLDSKQFDLLLQRFAHLVPIPKDNRQRTWPENRATLLYKISNLAAATARAG